MDRIDSQSEMTTEVSQQTGALDRRSALKQMMMGAIGVAASSTLVGCLGEGIPGSALSNPSANNGTAGAGEQGSFENPFTQEDPGSYATGLTARNPQIFGSLISNPDFTTKTTRLWVEVMGAPTAARSGTANTILPTEVFDVLATEELCSEGVTEIRIVDEDTKEILASRKLSADFQPRFIADVVLGSTTRVAAYAYIEGKGGWWKGDVYNSVDLEQYAPTTSNAAGQIGSLRKPLTRFNAGFLNVADGSDTGELASYKDYKHQGIWQAFGRKGLRWILADFDDDGVPEAHGNWTTGHKFVGGYVFDQNDQLISDTSYTWGDTGATLSTSDGKIAESSSTVTTSAINLGGGTGVGTTKQVPFITFPTLPSGVTSIRIVWLCSTDGWWESRYNNI